MAKKGVLKSLEKRLNDETNADNPLRTMSRFYVRIPLCFVHLNHPVGESATMGQYVDKRILDKNLRAGKSQRYQCCRSQTMSWPVRGKRGLWGCGRCKEAQKDKSEVFSIPQRSLKPYRVGNFCTEVLWRQSRVSPPQDKWLERKISSNEVLL